MDELAKLLNNVAKKMYLYRVLRVDADTEIVSKYCRNRRVDFDEFFESLPDNEQSNIIYKYCNKGVEELRRSLNILGFEIACENSEFCIVPFTARSEQSNFDINIINQWLENKYPNVAESYLPLKSALHGSLRLFSVKSHQIPGSAVLQFRLQFLLPYCLTYQLPV